MNDISFKLILLLYVLLLQGCINKNIRKEELTPNFIDKIITNNDGSRKYELFKGEKVASTLVWEGQSNAWVAVVYLGDYNEQNHLVISRSYFINNFNTRTEIMVKGHPMVLLSHEYEPLTGEKINSTWIHQKEGALYFDIMHEKYKLKIKQYDGFKVRELK